MTVAGQPETQNYRESDAAVDAEPAAPPAPVSAVPEGGRAASRALVVAAVLGLTLVCFGDALFAGAAFLVRDSAFYYPLFSWLAEEWGQGRIPFWNPYYNGGVPALADATAGIFYPVSLVFALPLEYGTRYALYIVLHFLLAALTSYWFARRCGTSRLAAGTCSVSYAFGGFVLYQFCNLIYLVSAAWLPAALAAALCMLERRSLAAALAMGAFLALMILGGEPQGALHAGLLATGYAFLLWRSERGAERGREPAPFERSPGWRELAHHRLFILGLAAASAGLLAAVQVLPSAELAEYSSRSSFEVPRSVFEVPAYLARVESTEGDAAGAFDAWAGVREGLLGSPEHNSHHRTYHYSVRPSDFLELVWPNFFGRDVRPGKWTASLYIGVLPLLLGLGAWSVRRGPPVQRWASWVVLFATLGAMGSHGLGWLVHGVVSLVTGAAQDDTNFGKPTGGVYWLLTVFVPSYAKFRGPAKLLLVATLGLSLLVARGWDQTCAGRGVTLRRVAGVLCLASGLAGLLALAPGVGAEAVPSAIAPALLHTAIVCGLLVALLGRLGGVRPGVPRLLFLLTVVELAVANAWLVVTGPSTLYDAPSRIVQQIASRDGPAAGAGSSRVYRSGRLPVAWGPAGLGQSGLADKMANGARWGIDTLSPRNHLLSRTSVLSFYSDVLFDSTVFLETAAAHESRRTGHKELPPQLLNALSTEYLILPQGPCVLPAERMADISGPVPAVLWHNPRCGERAWVVHDMRILPPLADRAPSQLERRTDAVLLDADEFRDFSRTAVVEADIERERYGVPDATGAASGVAEQDTCRITLDEPQHVVVEASLATPGLVVLNDSYYPGWKATVERTDQTGERAGERELPIWRTNRIMRGVWLPAGDHRLHFRFRPSRFTLGASLSALGWGVLPLLLLALRRRRSGGL